jgi:succinate dehydrogenase hydrophobic anchor subunit
MLMEEIMLPLKIPVLIITILFSLIGVYLAIRICLAGKKIDPSTLRALAFLNESFLKESWKLLLTSLILFIIHTVVELEEVFDAVINEKSSEILDEIIVLWILICLILLLYKWLKLMNPSKPNLNNRSQVRLQTIN